MARKNNKKKNVNVRVASLLLCAAGCAALAAPSAHAGSTIQISFEPSQTTVMVGQSFTVDIVASILQSQSIVGWGMDLSFDAGVLSHQPGSGVALGLPFTAAPGGDGDNLDGLVLPPNDPVFGDNVVLATLTFTAGSEGVTVISGGITGGDALEGFVRSGGAIVPATFGFTTITVTAIPAPPALLIGLGGLVVIGGRRRRRDA